MIELPLKPSGWGIVSSWGVTATVGLPVIQLQIGAGRLVMPIEHEVSKSRNLLEGIGPGLSLGISPEIVFWTDVANVSGSTEEMPSVGSRIFCRAGSGSVPPDAFEGSVVVISGSGTLGFGSAGGGAVIWHRQPATCKEWKCKLVRAAAKGIVLVGAAEFVMQTFAIGFVSGFAFDSDLIAAGLGSFAYSMKLAPPA